ncbi:Hypothetical predicted protein [Marmota monax]|uniref:Uncharacterized protein n=1 Tax=Marmota monax TaxID=9995 RepID=A0A5E4CM90_MARMO|nr:Hypothetical predicted protein [Marmota monax]
MLTLQQTKQADLENSRVLQQLAEPQALVLPDLGSTPGQILRLQDRERKAQCPSNREEALSQGIRGGQWGQETPAALIATTPQPVCSTLACPGPRECTLLHPHTGVTSWLRRRCGMQALLACLGQPALSLSPQQSEASCLPRGLSQRAGVSAPGSSTQEAPHSSVGQVPGGADVGQVCDCPPHRPRSSVSRAARPVALPSPSQSSEAAGGGEGDPCLVAQSCKSFLLQASFLSRPLPKNKHPGCLEQTVPYLALKLGQCAPLHKPRPPEREHLARLPPRLPAHRASPRMGTSSRSWALVWALEALLMVWPAGKAKAPRSLDAVFP